MRFTACGHAAAISCFRHTCSLLIAMYLQLFGPFALPAHIRSRACKPTDSRWPGTLLAFILRFLKLLPVFWARKFSRCFWPSVWCFAPCCLCIYRGCHPLRTPCRLPGESFVHLRTTILVFSFWCAVFTRVGHEGILWRGRWAHPGPAGSLQGWRRRLLKSVWYMINIHMSDSAVLCQARPSTATAVIWTQSVSASLSNICNGTWRPFPGVPVAVFFSYSSFDSKNVF